MEGSKGKGQIGLIGAGACSPELSVIAYEIGETIAANGFFLICGGLGGIMPEAALIQGSRAVWPKTEKPIVGITTRGLGGRVLMATGGRLP